ncbi:MAG: MerR family transcriptional regulator [Neisseriaceae bacterium]|nr:MAG: MerR family transcriptional regulator [Neisseriaceae bacterium]
MDKTWGVKEFSQMTGFTVRTLHYYDEEKLLVPKKRKYTGIRIYTYDDFLTAQKIIVLKYIGLSLDQIKHTLADPEFDLLTSLQLQVESLRDSIAQLNKGLVIAEKSVEDFMSTGRIKYDEIGNILNTFKVSHHDLTKKWSKRNFSDSERKFFDKKEFQKTKIDYEQEWVRLFTEAKEFLLQKQDPYSKDVQNLAKQWVDLWNEMSSIQYSENEELGERMWSLMKSGDVPDNLIAGYDHEVVSYMNIAMEYYESLLNNKKSEN